MSMASQWDKVILWLKKNFTLNFFIAIVTIISAWFGYDQYRRNNGGKVLPVIYPSYSIDTHYKDFLIITTGDSIIINNPNICPSYYNNSDFPIDNIYVNYTIKCPVDLKLAPVLEPNDGFSMRSQQFDTYNAYEWSIDYHKEILYPNETTPIPFKSISFFPNELKDSLFSYFDIESYVVYNGNKSEVFNSRINFTKISDNIRLNVKETSDSILSRLFFDWSSSSAKYLAGKTSQVADVLFAYHYTTDSCRRYGAFSHLKNLAPTDFDSLSILPTSPLFLRSHLYQFKEPTKEQSKIVWSDTIVGIILFCIAILLIVLLIRDWKSLNDRIILISIVLLLFSIAYLLFNSVLLYYNQANARLRITVCIIGVLSSLYPLLKGTFNILKKPKKGASDWLYAASLLIILVVLDCLFISEIINSLSI